MKANTIEQNKKMKLIWTISIVSVLLLISIVMNLIFWFTKSHNEKFVILNENIIYQDKIYIRQSDSLFAIQLDKQFGVTDLKQQVYKIIGQSVDSWICIRYDGKETIYRESNSEGFSFSSVNTLMIKDADVIGGEQITIKNKDIIKNIIEYISVENIDVTEFKSSKAVIFYSDEFSGLAYTLYYAHGEDGECYLIDSNSGGVWKIGHELMEYIK